MSHSHLFEFVCGFFHGNWRLAREFQSPVWTDEAALICALKDAHVCTPMFFYDKPEPNPLELSYANLLLHMGTETFDSGLQKQMEVRCARLTNLRDCLAKDKGPDIIPKHEQ
ncbi:hypothetical protein C8Q74DRAFT_1369884 [Fomes fomentarius]|nr:hypothetical protein C8Q74DRAFT_1369884 [Fomes fomentarius]